jgi:hypothetical protein
MHLLQPQQAPATTIDGSIVQQATTAAATTSFKAVHQTSFSPGRGNALQAAVASNLGLDLDQVPNFIEMPNGYEAAIREFWQEQQHGLNCIKINLVVDNIDARSDHDINSSSTALCIGKLCLLRGKSPRGDFGHVVVAKRMEDTTASNQQFQMVHDPHPDSTFLDESEAFGWCMFCVI